MITRIIYPNKQHRLIHLSESGSITVESAIVFPAVFLAVLALLFGAMIIHERVMLYHAASAAAERAAFRWDNSHRDSITGIAPTGRYDPLYWRLTDDRLLQSIFGMEGAEAEDASVDLPADGGESRGGLIAGKLLNGAGRAPEKYDGRAVYRRNLLLKRVSVELETFDIPSGAARLTGISGIRASADAPVSDPVELIRTVDLARYYAERFGIGTAGEEQRKKAGRILKEQSGRGSGG
jgi:hypothetical protein